MRSWHWQQGAVLCHEGRARAAVARSTQQPRVLTSRRRPYPPTTHPSPQVWLRLWPLLLLLHHRGALHPQLPRQVGAGLAGRGIRQLGAGRRGACARRGGAVEHSLACSCASARVPGLHRPLSPRVLTPPWRPCVPRAAAAWCRASPTRRRRTRWMTSPGEHPLAGGHDTSSPGDAQRPAGEHRPGWHACGGSPLARPRAPAGAIPARATAHP